MTHFVQFVIRSGGGVRNAIAASHRHSRRREWDDTGEILRHCGRGLEASQRTHCRRIIIVSLYSTHSRRRRFYWQQARLEVGTTNGIELTLKPQQQPRFCFDNISDLISPTIATLLSQEEHFFVVVSFYLLLGCFNHFLCCCVVRPQ